MTIFGWHSTGWDWHNGTFLVNTVGVLIIPVALAAAALRGNHNMHKMIKNQGEHLARQHKLIRDRRKDEILMVLDSTSRPDQLRRLWEEIAEFDEPLRSLLLSAFRANPHVPLLGSSGSFEDGGDFGTVKDYCDGLEARYCLHQNRGRSFRGLVEFVEPAARMSWFSDEVQDGLLDLVTGVRGRAALAQRPNSDFYWHLVRRVPTLAPGLLRRIPKVSMYEHGGLRFNLLAGTVRALSDVAVGAGGLAFIRDRDEFRLSLTSAIPELLKYGELRDFETWNEEGWGEPLALTVARLVRVVGWICDIGDPYLSDLMIPNLPATIRDVPPKHQIWGLADKQALNRGFTAIETGRPELWARYRARLEEAADSVGEWRDSDRR